ncbi:unnamed protein product [Closterium sp. Naga37s-1]|nr:unnamed protein product [Closterium sp. Naga37s-1]
MRFCWIVHWAAVGAAVGGAVAARRGAVGARGGAAGDVSRQQVTTSRVWTMSRVLDSEWHHGQWQAMTQADRIFHTTLRWLLVLLIGTCTGLIAFLVNLAVEAIGGAKFGLVFSHIKGQNFLGGFLVLAATNLGLVLVSTCLCNGIAMEAVGSGIPEVKGYLNGVSTPAVLSAKTLLVKALGSIAAVAGGLAVGKEGPLVHCGACIASILGRLSHRISARRDLSRPRKPRIQAASSFASLGLFFNHGSIKALRTPVWVHSDRGLRDLVTCGAASGVAAAFLAPVGGVLFALEQVTSWWRNSLIWRIFFTNAVVAMVLRACISLCEGDRCGGSFGSRGFILFDRSKSRTDFGLLEVVSVALLGVVGGLLGGLFNHLNVKLCAYRKNRLHRHGRLISPSRHGAWARVLEVLLISLLTSALRFYGPFLASCLPCPQDPDERGGLPQGSFNCPSVVGTGDHKAFACPDGQYNDLASLVFTTNDDAIGNLFRTGSFGIFTYSSLVLSFTTFFLLATLTYGAAVPAGLFVPSILCGASYGRMAGMLMTHLYTSLLLSFTIYFALATLTYGTAVPAGLFVPSILCGASYGRMAGIYSSLLLSFTIYFALATLTYGTAVPAGLFVPSILCGASYGRMAGIYTSLLLSFTIYFALATLTYGTAVPAGLFVPSILCGASYGRMAGMFMVTLFGPHRVGEGTYALLGAASFLGGSMRMTVSLSVILLELTGSLKLLPLVMVVLLVSKSVGDLFNRNIDDSHVDLKGIPYLPENCTHQDFTLFEEDGEEGEGRKEGEERGEGEKGGVLSRVTADNKHQQQQQQQQQQEQKQKQLVTGMGCSFGAAADILSPQSPPMTPQQSTPPFSRFPAVTFVPRNSHHSFWKPHQPCQPCQP